MSDSTEAVLSRSGRNLVVDGRTFDFWVARVEDVYPNCKARVQEAVKKTREKVRGDLQRESGLRLANEKEGAARIRLEIKPGLPIGVVEVLEGLDPDLLSLVSLKPAVLNAVRGLGGVLREREVLERVDGPPRPVPFDELVASCRWLESFYEWLASIRLPGIETIFSLDELGAYWPRESKITIHWLAIGVAGLWLRQKPETLTPLILAHEMSHAIHHQAFDIDGERWSTRDFLASEATALEAIAQVYSEHWVQGSAARHPEFLPAWEGLLEAAPAMYRAHQGWLDQPRALEVVRAATLMTRKPGRGGVRLKHLLKALDDAYEDLCT